MSEKRTVAIIGGGAAGLMAAAYAAEIRDPDTDEILLIEQNDRMGKKLRITGKGRCNLTNDCDRDEFLSNVPTNPRFLYASLAGFDTKDTQEYFESLGVPLKVERGKRVFPVSDKAGDVVEALVRRCRELGVKTLQGRVSAIHTEAESGAPRVTALRVGGKDIPVDAAILCTGGCSYPVTGSDGNGYKLAERLGHTVVPPRPSLVPLVCEGNLCSRMMGLSLRNVNLRVLDTAKGKYVYEDFGEMLFTHYGVTGPLVLSASAHIPDVESGKYELHVNLKPALDDAELDARILADFKKYANRDFINALSDLLPIKAIEPVVELSGIDPRVKVNAITKEQRKALAAVLHCIRLKPVRPRPIAEAIVTKGGIKVSEVDPKTMGSKLVDGLYFAGEVLDVDAYTGGFNLQIAFSTARLAAQSAVWG
ncbi:MAG: NAD(P)/FAD-dependent oxidoreductase [Ruminococcaceae bacterium]|nr:NAD(P)/FAD-dependent oxidoreductase [Oscillospiraceae bacterium]